jgi:hypothetical protein
MLKIKSIEELKAWNASPTKEKPYVAEWFFDYFFELLENNNYKKARDAHNTYIKFSKVCEGMLHKMAIELMKKNLEYYARYSNRWVVLLNKFYKYCEYEFWFDFMGIAFYPKCDGLCPDI